MCNCEYLVELYFNSFFSLHPLDVAFVTKSSKTLPSRRDSLFPSFHCFSASSQSLNKTFCNLVSLLKIKELEMNNSWHIIDLSHNSIEFINSPDLLQKQIHLETLRLNFNSAFKGHEDKQILNHRTLQNFECAKCGFVDIQSQHFAGLASLSELHLSANRINKINENSFNANANLRLLDLTENQLTVIPYLTFADLTHFEDLYLTLNKIVLPNKAFLKSQSLKHLKMDDCNITDFYPATLTELPHLETLNLNRNRIKSLPVNSFKSNKVLKSLFIESNRLRFFPTDVLDMLPKMVELCTDNNTFNQTLDFANFVKKYNDRLLRTKNCNDNVTTFIENLFNDDVSTDVPSEIQNSTEKSSILVKKGGVSVFFFGSYITFVLAVQAAAFVLLSIYLLKITKFDKFDGEVNYANTILNDDEIYRVYKSTE